MSGPEPLAAPAWRTISLAELNVRAPLLDRAEHKYVVDERDLPGVLDELRPFFDVLEIDGIDDFTYDTVYFDTVERMTYRQHAQGRRRRVKIRSRRYVDTPDLCFFEVKLKGQRGRTIKERMPYAPADHGTVTADAAAFVESAVERTYGEPFPHRIVPSLAMRYRRRTLVGREAPERVTIDRSLQFTHPAHQRGVRATAPAIIEVKSPDGRGIADRVIRSTGRSPEPCSKYCVGLNLTDRDLTYNTFNRTLRRHFDWKGPAMTTVVAQQDRIEVGAAVGDDPAPVEGIAVEGIAVEGIAVEGIAAEGIAVDMTAVARLVAQLRRRFPDAPSHELGAIAQVALTSFADAPVRNYVEVLAYRRAVSLLAHPVAS